MGRSGDGKIPFEDSTRACADRLAPRQLAESFAEHHRVARSHPADVPLQASPPSTEARPEHREPPVVRAPARWHPATEAIYAVIFAACLVAAVVLLSG
jgi:hypothetical protein